MPCSNLGGKRAVALICVKRECDGQCFHTLSATICRLIEGANPRWSANLIAIWMRHETSTFRADFVIAACIRLSSKAV